MISPRTFRGALSIYMNFSRVRYAWNILFISHVARLVAAPKADITIAPPKLDLSGYVGYITCGVSITAFAQLLRRTYVSLSLY